MKRIKTLIIVFYFLFLSLSSASGQEEPCDWIKDNLEGIVVLLNDHIIGPIVWNEIYTKVCDDWSAYGAAGEQLCQSFLGDAWVLGVTLLENAISRADDFAQSCEELGACYLHGNATYCKTKAECDDMFWGSLLEECDDICQGIELNCEENDGEWWEVVLNLLNPTKWDDWLECASAEAFEIFLSGFTCVGGAMAFPDCMTDAAIYYYFAKHVDSLAQVIYEATNGLITLNNKKTYEIGTCLDYLDQGGEWTCPETPPQTVYVDQAGQCPADGTEAEPLPLVSTAVARVADRGTVVIKGGGYREKWNTNKNIRLLQQSGSGTVSIKP